MADGRFFSREITSDKTQGIVINESAVEAMGLENPLGKRFSFSQRKDGRIIGVIKDFQIRSFHYEVEPMFLFLEPSWFSYLCVKIRSENVTETLKFLEENWKRYNPQYPFEFGFFDEAIDGLYRSEVRVGTIFQYFTVLAIFISCLGLFGLASFMAQRRTKEIGIRKILGASGTRICLLLSGEFLKWVILANFIAWPIAYIFMQQWLQNFAFRINIGLWIFVFSAGLSLFITILTISYQSIKSAFSNPVESLRYE
jgi:putative ABC transport system permease protein